MRYQEYLKVFWFAIVVVGNLIMYDCSDVCVELILQFYYLDTEWVDSRARKRDKKKKKNLFITRVH